MSDHRIRLTDQDIALICSALLARAAASGPERRHHINRLAMRLGEGIPGNPAWIFSVDEQTHEFKSLVEKIRADPQRAARIEAYKAELVAEVDQ